MFGEYAIIDECGDEHDDYWNRPTPELWSDEDNSESGNDQQGTYLEDDDWFEQFVILPDSD